MKIINRLLAAAAILLSAAACHTSEIDNPGHTDPVNPDPGTPDESGLTISASIVKTRVTYSDIDADLDQEWEEGDILFGYYYSGEVRNRVILKVDDFDEYGDAILKPVNVDGVASLSALAKLGDDVPVDLVYTGKNVGDYVSENAVQYPFDAGGNLTIDMNPEAGFQDGVNIPACMHARAYVETDKNDQDKKSLFFTFVNDCAIIEIYSLTGIKENIKLQSDVALTSLSVSNLVLKGKYTLGTEGFEFGASEIVAGYDDVPVVTDYVYNFGPNDDWKVNSNAEIRKGNTQNRYLIAVVPNEYTTYITEDGPDESGITVSATIGANSYSFGYGQHVFDAGKCYVIHEADVVAKTIDGLYFTTVTGAFNHAADLFDLYDLDAEHNIVTLVRDCGFAGINAQGKSWTGGTASIVINGYDATFDLNGHTLTLDGGNEHFSIAAGYELVITDSKGKDKQGKYHGMIQSDPDGSLQKHVIYNEGTLQIDGGQLIHNQDWCVVSNSSNSSLIVNDGVLYSGEYHAISNEGDVTINGGAISAYYYAIANWPENVGNVNICGGTIYSETEYAVYSENNYNASISITIDKKGLDCPKIFTLSDSNTAIYVENATDSTNFNMNDGLVYSSFGAIEFRSNVSGTISGGQIEGNSYSALTIGEGSDITISGGKFLTNSSENPAIRVYSTNEGNPSSLKIEGVDDKNVQPLLYSISSTKPCLVADAFASSYNYSTVNISGGFLFSSSPEFYAEIDMPSGHLELTDFGEFYSNRERLFYSNKSHYLYNESGHDNITVEPINDNVAVPLKVGDKDDSVPVSLTFHQVNSADNSLETKSSLDISFNYHITNPD